MHNKNTNIIRRVSLVSNSDLFYKTEEVKVKNRGEGWRVKDAGEI